VLVVVVVVPDWHTAGTIAQTHRHFSPLPACLAAHWSPERSEKAASVSGGLQFAFKLSAQIIATDRQAAQNE